MSARQAESKINAALAADSELKQIDAAILKALSAEGTGQFKTAMDKLSEQRLAATKRVLNGLDIDWTSLKSSRSSQSQNAPGLAAMPSWGKALDAKILKGYVAGDDTPDNWGPDLSFRTWDVKIDKLTAQTGGIKGDSDGCEQIKVTALSGPPAVMALASGPPAKSGYVSCEANRLANIPINVPPIHDGFENPSVMFLKAYVRRAGYRVYAKGSHDYHCGDINACALSAEARAHLGLITNFGLCQSFGDTLKRTGDSQGGIGFEEYSEGFTISCKVPLNGTSGTVTVTPKIKIEYWAQTSNGFAGIAASSVEMSIDSIEAKVFYDKRICKPDLNSKPQCPAYSEAPSWDEKQCKWRECIPQIR